MSDEPLRPGWDSVWPAPAKLNLMLRIVGRRDDGYHLLQTVFQLLDWGDEIRFHPDASGQITLRTPTPGVPMHADLTVRAAALLRAEAGCSEKGVSMEVCKRIPMGGGLGGGSSDSATVLVALNWLWAIDFPVEKLMSLALRLGADVPVFVKGHSAWAEGVGEILTEIDLPEQWFVIVKPECHVVTKEIFCAEDLTRNSKPIIMSDFMSGTQNNDCLAVVRRLHAEVARALDELSSWGAAKLTGTGSCVFLACSDYQEAERVAKHLHERGRHVFVVQGVNVSPLQRMLSDFVS